MSNCDCHVQANNAAGLVSWTGSRIPDLVVGAAIGLYVVKEAIEILRDAQASTTKHNSSEQSTDP